MIEDSSAFPQEAKAESKRAGSTFLFTRRAARWILPGLVFAAFVASISYRVSPNHGVLMYGDYPYYWPNHAFEPFSVVQSSFLGYIRLTGMAPAFLMELPRMLSAVLPNSWASYLLTYGLIYATCLTYYFVASRLTGSTAIGYVAGFFIILNSVVLEYLVIQPSHIFAALIVYAITLYIFFRRRRDGFRVRHVLFLALVSLALTHPFLWIMQVILVAALFLFLRVSTRKRVLAAAVSTFALMALLASFWIIPFAVGSLQSSTANLYAGNQNAVFEGVRTKVHYVEAFDLLQMPGTWQSDVYGRVPNLFYFGTLAFVVTVFLLRGRRGAVRACFLFLLALYLVTLNLGLGPNSALTGKLWLYAYDHVPGFGFFRTFSRFINLALVALVFLVVYSFSQLRRDRFRYYRPLVGLFLVSLVVSHLVFFTGDMDGTITAAKAPSQYASLNAKFLDTASDFSVATYPNLEYEAYRWDTPRKPKVFQQITYFKEFFFDQQVIFNRLASNDLNIHNDYFPRLFAYDKSFSFYPSFDEDLNKLDVKYVLVHKDLFDVQEIIRNLPSLRNNQQALALGAVPYEWYVSYFTRDSRYQLVDDNAAFVLYENKAYMPRVRTTDAVFQRVNDTTYRVHVSNLTAKRDITLLQQFDSGWHIYPQRTSSSGNWCREVSMYPGGLTECAKAVTGFDLEAATRALPGGTLSVPHTEALGYANQWRIDAESIRKQFSSDYYSVNPDGSINADFLIYFRPQSYFYLALMITFLTMFVCLVGLIGLGVRAMRRRRKEIVGADGTPPKA